MYRLLTGYFTAKKIINNEVKQEEINNYAFRCGIREVNYDLLQICAIHQFAMEKVNPQNESFYSKLKCNLITEILLSLADLVQGDICKFETYEPEVLLELLRYIIDKIPTSEAYWEDRRDIVNQEYAYLKAAYESIERLRDCMDCINDEKIRLFNNDLSDEAIYESSRFLLFVENEIKQGSNFILKYMWLSLHSSAGTRAFLNIFSNLSFVPYLQFFSDSAIRGVQKKILLLLDEPDLYCHPEWQRRMLYDIIGTIDKLYKGYSIHVIFSTHSPLFLSDMPNQNVILLDNKVETLT